MDIELPATPVGVIALAGLLTPYLVALVNHPTWSANSKRIVAILGSMLVSILSLAGYYIWTREPVPEIVPLLVLGILVSQAAYALAAKSSAARVERATTRQPH